MDNFLYPSVTVCKKYTFNNYIDHIFADGSLTLQDIIERVGEESLDIEELFYFFSHPGMLNLTFPCTTLGRPGYVFWILRPL